MAIFKIRNIGRSKFRPPPSWLTNRLRFTKKIQRKFTAARIDSRKSMGWWNEKLVLFSERSLLDPKCDLSSFLRHAILCMLQYVYEKLQFFFSFSFLFSTRRWDEVGDILYSRRGVILSDRETFLRRAR